MTLYADHRYPPPFPTRRSSDLAKRRVETADGLKTTFAKRHVAAGNVFSVVIGKQDVNGPARRVDHARDRKSTRLNSSHMSISYAVFCLKKKRQATLKTVF